MRMSSLSNTKLHTNNDQREYKIVNYENIQMISRQVGDSAH